MARKRVAGSGITFNTWEECDEGMRAIGERRRDMQAIESVMNEQIAAAKKLAADRTKPMTDEIRAIEIALMDYATKHREDMGKAKSKVLNFGTVGFRKSTRISLPAAAEKLRVIIAKLMDMGMADCIKQPEPKVDKDALRKYSADMIIKAGASVITEDAFGYEIDEEKIV